MKILFIDDDQEQLKSLQRLLRRRQTEWEMYFAYDVHMAMQMLAQTTIDVVVTDFSAAGVDSVSFLEYLQAAHPSTVRIILSGRSDRQLGLKAAGLAHRFLSKPCDPELLTRVIDEQRHLQDLLNNPAMRKIIARTRSLPSQPALYSEILHELESPNASADRVGEIVAKDPGMTAKVLQLVNSAFFGLSRQVCDPAQATVLLGLETIRDLVLTIGVFSQFDSYRLEKLGLAWLWNHSLRVGKFARLIMQSVTSKKGLIENAFTAGLLHDIGILVLAENFPRQYYTVSNQVRQPGVGLMAAELDTFGVTHGQVGAYLLGLWGLPALVVQAAALHDDLTSLRTQEVNPVVVVHVANIFDHEMMEKDGAFGKPLPDTQYLPLVGNSADIDRWRRLCQEVVN